jgi:CzcA family heavy metal efflux pump
MFLTRLALRNPVSVLMISIVLVVLALFSIQLIPIDSLPNLTIPSLQIITPYVGADPQTVEQSVTYPMEKVISSVSNISYIQSFSREGLSIVRAYFDWGSDINSEEVEAIQRADSILTNLPPGVGTPFVLKFDISNFPVCALALESKSLNQRQLYDVAFNTIEPSLEHQPGVSTAPVNGGLVRQINVYVDRRKQAGYGVSLQDIYNAVAHSNFIFPSGDIKIGPIDYRVYTKTMFENIPSMNQIVVASRNGVPIHVGDLGEVLDSSAEQTQIVRINGRHGIMMFVSKEPGKNTVKVVDAIQAWKKSFFDQLHQNPLYKDLQAYIFFNQATPIRDAIQSLAREALIGACLAALVILVFLGDIRSTVFVSISMPMSALSAVFLLYLTGQTFNIFTLGGLALAMGRLVDDAIVVIENIFRHMHLGEEPLVAALKGTQEVGMPVLASTITTVVVFLPIVFLSGLAKILFAPLALTVTFALFASYFCSMTIIPVLSRYWLKVEKHQRQEKKLPRWVEFYGKVLRNILQMRWIVVGILVLLFLTIIFPLKTGLPFFNGGQPIGKELIPPPDENLFIVTGKMPIGTRLHVTEKTVAKCEDIIRKLLGKQITVMASDMGTPSTARGTNAAAAAFSQNGGPHGFTIRVNLVPSNERSMSVFQDVTLVQNALVGRFPGVQIFTSPAGLLSFLLNLGAQGAIDVQIQGYNLNTDFALAHQVAAIINGIPGARKPARIVQENGYPEIHIDVDREKAQLLGFSVENVADTVLTALNGNTQTNTIWTDPTNGNQYNVITQYPLQYQKTFNDVQNITFISPNGQPFPLKSIAAIKIQPGPLEIDRQNEVRLVDVVTDAVNRPLGDVAEDIQNAIQKEIKLPLGYTIRVAGQFQSQQHSFAQMPWAMALSILIIYAVMATQFRSLVDPFIIIFTVPLGFIGVFWMLYITKTPLSIESFMGIITMIGIVVSNGILLVDFANQLRRQGLDAVGAVIKAAQVRLRPILMTAIATVFGLIPMALGIGAGSEEHAPLARAVIGGLLVSTFLTLFLIPILYTFWEKKETQIGDEI